MIVIDTHVWLWWVDDPHRLSTPIRSALEQSENSGIVVSVASVWELALKAERGRLALKMDTVQWVAEASRYPGVRVEPLLALDAVASAQLPGRFHGDPFDRVIVALARRLGFTLATSDRKIIEYPHVATVS